MAGSGTATLNFGAFPGASDTSVAVTGQAGIVSGSLVEAWIRPEATADHSADEHMLETIKVFAHTIVAGTGFTISGFNTSEITEGLEQGGAGRAASAAPGGESQDGNPRYGGMGTRIYGTFKVAWAWT